MNTLRIEGVAVEKKYAYTFESKNIKDVIFNESSTDGVLLYSPTRATLLTKLDRPLEAPCIEELTYNRDYHGDLSMLKAELNYFNNVSEVCFQRYCFQKDERYPFVPFHETHATSPYRYMCTEVVEEHCQNSLFFLVEFEMTMATKKGSKIIDELYMEGTIQISGRVQ